MPVSLIALETYQPKLKQFKTYLDNLLELTICLLPEKQFSPRFSLAINYVFERLPYIFNDKELENFFHEDNEVLFPSLDALEEIPNHLSIFHFITTVFTLINISEQDFSILLKDSILKKLLYPLYEITGKMEELSMFMDSSWGTSEQLEDLPLVLYFLKLSQEDYEEIIMKIDDEDSLSLRLQLLRSFNKLLNDIDEKVFNFKIDADQTVVPKLKDFFKRIFLGNDEEKILKFIDNLSEKINEGNTIPGELIGVCEKVSTRFFSSCSIVGSSTLSYKRARDSDDSDDEELTARTRQRYADDAGDKAPARPARHYFVPGLSE